MLRFFEKAIRRGLNGIGEKLFMKANNFYLPDFDKTKPTTYGLFLDVVNLYGGTMMKKMPLGGFKWVNITLQEILNTSEESDEGYFVMVDLQYPNVLHNKHYDLPLAAEKLEISRDFHSPYQKQFHQHEAKTKKLMENLIDKSDYVCHYSLLKFFVSRGLIITKISKVLQFRLSNFLKPYIDKNTRLRQEPGISDFRKNFFKLLINSCFGKTMKNLRRRKNLIIVTNEKQAEFYCNQFNFKSFRIFKEDMMAVTILKKLITWNKPTYLGAAVLDVSKLQLYQFHHKKNCS